MDDGFKWLDEWARINQGRYVVGKEWTDYDHLSLMVSAETKDGLKKLSARQEINASQAFDIASQIQQRLNYMATQIVHEMWKQPEKA